MSTEGLPNSRSYSIEEGRRDPLDIARQQIDFAAMAASAPAIKGVLYKASLMAPVVKAKPSGKGAGKAAVAGALVVMAVAPWFPTTSELSVVNVNFERQLSRPEAQAVTTACVLGAPEDTLVGAEFTPLQTGRDSRGQLKLRFTGADLSVTGVDTQARGLIEAAAPGCAPDFGPGPSLSERHWRSPLQLALARLDPEPTLRSPHTPGSDLAGQVQRSTELLSAELDRRLAQFDLSLKVRKALFLPPQVAVTEHYDFALPAWPAPLALSIDGYGSLLTERQYDVQSACAAVLVELNLSLSNATQLALAGAGAPLYVQVLDREGGYDPYLSAQVQARVPRLTDEQRLDGSFDAEKTLQGLLADYAPQLDFDLLIERQPADMGALPVFIGTARVIGERTDRPFGQRSRNAEEYFQRHGSEGDGDVSWDW